MKALCLLLALISGNAWGATLGDYRFASGSRLTDSSGSGNTLISNGTPLYSDTTGVCAYTGAVGINTAANYVSAPAAVTSGLNGKTTYTLSTYFYAAAGGPAFQVLLGSTTGGGTSYALYLESTARIRWYNQTTDTIVCSACVSINTCYKVDLVADGVNTLVYLDGVLKLTDTLFTWPNRGVSFGIRSGNSDGVFNGYISGVVIKDCYPCTSTPTPIVISPYVNQFTSPFVTPRWNR